MPTFQTALEIPMIVILIGESLHLRHRFALPLLRGRAGANVVGFELVGDGDQVEVEVIPDELADFGVFVIPD